MAVLSKYPADLQVVRVCGPARRALLPGKACSRGHRCRRPLARPPERPASLRTRTFDGPAEQRRQANRLREQSSGDCLIAIRSNLFFDGDLLLCVGDADICRVKCYAPSSEKPRSLHAGQTRGSCSDARMGIDLMYSSVFVSSRALTEGVDEETGTLACSWMKWC